MEKKSNEKSETTPSEPTPTPATPTTGTGTDIGTSKVSSPKPASNELPKGTVLRSRPKKGRVPKKIPSRQSSPNLGPEQSIRGPLLDNAVNSLLPKQASGEELQPLTNDEWQKSEFPFPPDLINVKKRHNKVTVFSAKTLPDANALSSNDRLPVALPILSPPKPPAPAPAPIDMNLVQDLARMLKGVVGILEEDKSKTEGVEVTVSIRIGEGHRYFSLPYFPATQSTSTVPKAI